MARDVEFDRLVASLLAASRRADGGESTHNIDAAIDALIDLAVRNRDREAPAAACRRRVSASL